MSRTAVPRLHLISNRQLCGLAEFHDLARRAVAGGVEAVHLREKDLSATDLLSLARALHDALEGRARLFVNDRLDIAVLSGADGVQLGEQSVPVADARAIAGRLLIGRSVHDLDGARQASADGADFVLAGHVYETQSKQGQAGRGAAFIESLARICPIPIIAIGGITPARVPEVIGAGAYGVAVISGILQAYDPEAAARSYADALPG